MTISASVFNRLSNCSRGQGKREIALILMFVGCIEI